MQNKCIYKAKSNNKWYIGCYVYDSKLDTHYLLVNNEDANCMDTHVIDVNTLCRFTCMTDCTGRKFFEHDIVELPDEDSDCGLCFRYEIMYDEGDCAWFLNDVFNAECYSLGEFKADELYYAGNIFDNPELLEDTGERNEEEN